MNIIGIIGLVMLITAIFISGGLLIDEFETNYVDTNISSADTINQSIRDDLITQDTINETFDPLHKNVEDLQSQEGFLDVVGDGTVVLPIMFINFVVAILKFIGFSTTQSFVILKYLGIPIVLITFLGVGIIVWFTFKIIEQLRRYPT